jgi:hypothetical protein
VDVDSKLLSFRISIKSIMNLMYVGLIVTIIIIIIIIIIRLSGLRTGRLYPSGDILRTNCC